MRLKAFAAAVVLMLGTAFPMQAVDNQVAVGDPICSLWLCITYDNSYIDSSGAWIVRPSYTECSCLE